MSEDGTLLVSMYPRAALLACALAASACAEESESATNEPLFMEFGIGIDETYVVLEDGDMCDIRDGPASVRFWILSRSRTNAPNFSELDCVVLVGDE